MNEDKMREEFATWYGEAYPNTTWAPEDWILWQAACASRQKEIDALVEAMPRISDRKQSPVAWRHESTCEFISDEVKRGFPDTLFVRKCNIPLYGEPIIGTTEFIHRPSDIIFREQIDALNTALKEVCASKQKEIDELLKANALAYKSSEQESLDRIRELEAKLRELRKLNASKENLK